LRNEPEEDEDQIEVEKCYTCRVLLERHWVKKFFRVCAVFNILSLAFSAPLRVCSEVENRGNGTDLPGEDCEGVFVQFVVIAVADVILALVYSVQLSLRIQYMIFLCFKKGKRVRGDLLGTHGYVMIGFLLPGSTHPRVYRVVRVGSRFQC
jgi:hypothetical protein